MTTLPSLSLLETRVLGVLAEKQRTVPDSYPMTLNALLTGCNQKTSRDPVMEAAETEVQAALDNLKCYSLVMETSGGRVARYAHNIEKVLKILPHASVLMTALMLRGAQTAGELRIGCERLHRFADISAVEACLSGLRSRPEGALVVELPRLPGARETRWSHLLSGQPVQEPLPAEPSAALDVSRASAHLALGDMTALQANVARLEAQVTDLKAVVSRLCNELGLPYATDRESS